MSEDLRWIVGLAVSICLFFGAALIGAFRNLSAKMTSSTGDIHKRIDDVKERYVRRDDLDGHLNRLDRNVQEVREEMRDQHRQVMDVLTRMNTKD